LTDLRLYGKRVVPWKDTALMTFHVRGISSAPLYGHTHLLPDGRIKVKIEGVGEEIVPGDTLASELPKIVKRILERR